jgi:cysteine synthase
MKAIESEMYGSPRYFLSPTHNPLPPAFPLPRRLNPFAGDGVTFIPVPIFGTYVPNMKTAMVRWMLERAQMAGKLAGVHTLVEASSGNTAAAEGVIAPNYGIKRVVPVVDRDIAFGKLELLRLTRCDAPRYPMDGKTTIETARELGKQSGWLNLDQYANPANPEAHETWTGPHIWQQTGENLSVFVAPLGTAGTVIGVSNFLRQQPVHVAVVGVALAPGEAVPGVRTEEKLKQVAFDWRSAIDDLVLVSRIPSYMASMDLIGSGRMFGPSSGSTFCGALQFIARWKSENLLDSLRSPEDGQIVVAFTCGDTPFPYADKYATLLEGQAFESRGSLDCAEL